MDLGERFSEVCVFDHLGRTNPRLLYPIRHRGPQAQQDLAMIRARQELVTMRTALINHARGVVKSHGKRLARCDNCAFVERAGEQIPEGLRGPLSGVMRTAGRRRATRA